ncbi:amino acid adenylation domain-containing protein [Streptomyces sp. NPDC059104]|uniref:amino acid adenylation domain-containing protein n=1 Tax=Streptomyces sp. NPDC059104 TaxID=3346729 RepID=UPI0036CC19E4
MTAGPRPVLRGPRTHAPAPQGVPGLIRDVVEADPDRIACEDADRVLTYGELDRLSDEFAERLGVSSGAEPVALLMRRSVDVLVAMTGVLKAGRPYLPLDVDEPEARLVGMVRDARPVAVVHDAGLPRRECLAALPHHTVGRAVPAAGQPRPLPQREPDAPMYVMFTSGSTGEPKGVVQGTAGVVNRLRWMREQYAVTPDDRILHKTPYTFDVSGWELFLPLVSGARCVIAAPGAHRDPTALVDLTARARITLCHFVPSMLAEFLSHPRAAEGLAPLRALFSSGEALPPGLAHRFHQLTVAELHNLYGPTEAAIDVTHWQVPRGLAPDDRVLIGAPIDNVALYVLDATGRDVPSGEPGELWIGGPAVALGYTGRPDLTEASFRISGTERRYRTGDLVRERDGQLEYLGRRDEQVKVRGVRIELREVEAALATSPDVEHAVATVVRDTADGTGDLVAGITPARHGSDGHPVDPREVGERVRAHLTRRLPAGWLPSGIHLVEHPPVNRSGKLDRHAVRATLAAWWQTRRSLAPARPDDTIGALWQRVLGAPHGTEERPFLSLGGHSLAAARLVGAVRDACGVEVPVSLLLSDNVTLAGLRGFVDAAPRQDQGPAELPGPGIRVPLAPEQRRLWLLGRLFPDSAAYNVVAALRLRGELDVPALRAALCAVAARHDLLSTRVVQDTDGDPLLVHEPAATLPVHVETVHGELTETVEAALLRDFHARVLPDDRAPMARAAVWHAPGTGRALLTLAFNHLVADQRTVDLVLAQTARAYAELRSGGLPVDTQGPSYRAYAVRSVAREGSARRQADLDHWREVLADAPRELNLPFRGQRPVVPAFNGADHFVHLGREESARIDERLATRGATPAGFFLTCLAVVLGRWAGERSVVIGMPASRRRSDEEQDLVGFLVDTLPVRIDLAADQGFGELLGHVTERYADALDHAGPTFEAIVDALDVSSRPDRNPLFQVWFNDLTQAAQAPAMPGLEVSFRSVPTQFSLFDIGLYVHRDADGGYACQLVWDRDVFTRDVAVELLESCVRVAGQAVRDDSRTPASFSLRTERADALAPAVPDAALPQAGPRTSPLADILEATGRHASLPAVVSAEGVLDHADVGRLITRLGGELVARGIRPGDTVAVRAERHPLLSVALLAVWWAGAAVSVVDAALPAARLAACADRVPAKALLVFGPAGPAAGTVLSVPGLLEGARPVRQAIAPVAHEGGTSHYLFTSGTTGEPSAVAVPHGPLRDFLQWYVREHGFGTADRFAFLAGPGHDPVLRDVLTPLCVGATLHVPDPALVTAPDRLFEWLSATDITVVHATPALLELLVAAHASRPAGRLGALRLLVVGGAPLSAGLVRRVRAFTRARIVNAYGTTETPQIVAWADADPGPEVPDAAALPVGRAAHGHEVVVLDALGRVAGLAERGEVAVRSRNLASGYVGPGRPRPGFAEDAESDVRTYRTGDLGRYDTDGRLHIDGRGDRQVSVNGYRVELDEIEAAALRHPAIRQALASVEDTPAGTALVLRVVAAPGADLPAESVRRHLRGILPLPAVPGAVLVDGRLALTANLKAAAPARGRAGEAHGRQSSGPAAATPLARRISLLLEETLRREIGPDENFFDAGLNSISLVRLHARIAQSLNRTDFPVTVMFHFPNVRSLARFLSGEPATREGEETPARSGSGVRLDAAFLTQVVKARRDVRERIRMESKE